MDGTASKSKIFEKRLDLRQDKRYREFVASMGFEWVAIKTDEGFAYGYIKYLPLLRTGFMKVQRYRGQIDEQDLRRAIGERRIFRTILEPLSAPKGIPARISGDPFLPTATRVIELKQWKKGLSENVIRIIKKKTSITQGEGEVGEFFEAWRANSKIWTLSREAVVSLKDKFGEDCIMWVERRSGEIVGGILCLVCGEWAYYFAAFVNSEGRKDYAGVLGVVSLCEELCKRGVRYLDFEGVYDERFPKKSWRGFSEFKARFGGEVINLPGCFGRWF